MNKRKLSVPSLVPTCGLKWSKGEHELLFKVFKVALFCHRFLCRHFLPFQAIPFNLPEGGKHIISILNNTAASVVVIFVRTSGNF
jgi:hypothetical protein